MSCKSALYAAMQTPTAVAVDGVIPLGSLIRRYGCDVALNGNAVNITGAGYYDVDASVTQAFTDGVTVLQGDRDAEKFGQSMDAAVASASS